jgi:hypothetical protein
MRRRQGRGYSLPAPPSYFPLSSESQELQVRQRTGPRGLRRELRYWVEGDFLGQQQASIREIRFPAG